MANANIRLESSRGITTLTFACPTIDLSMAHEMREASYKIAIASNSATANGATKALLRKSIDMSLPQQLAAEEDGFVTCAHHGDFAEGVSAFLSKRRPLFVHNE